MGGTYEVHHHTQFLNELISAGKIAIDNTKLAGKKVTYHDPCYLGRANGEYNAPRELIKSLGVDLVEMSKNKSFALCCGAGGGQMFKEAEKGDKEVYMARTKDALETNAEIVVTACPYCMVMLTDGLKYTNKIDEIKNLDLAELLAEAMEI